MKDQIASAPESPWLDYGGASERLRIKFNVELTPRTIQNKVSTGDIPTTVIAGKRRIHVNELDAWALGTPAEATP